MLYFSLLEILNYAVISSSRLISHRVVSSCNIMHTFTGGGKPTFLFHLLLALWTISSVWHSGNCITFGNWMRSRAQVKRRGGAQFHWTERISSIVQPKICVCVYVCMYIYKHTYIHTHTHTYIYTHI